MDIAGRSLSSGVGIMVSRELLGLTEGGSDLAESVDGIYESSVVAPMPCPDLEGTMLKV